MKIAPVKATAHARPADGKSSRGTSVVIVGCGFGGLAAAIELKRSGFENITVLERGASVGGVWRDNTYPGARCDLPSSIYSFSYALKSDWSARYGSQSEIHCYLTAVAEEFGLESLIRFNTEATSAEFNEAAGTWTVTTEDGDQTVADVLILATGQLSRPRMPDVLGLDTFGGASFHSARWNHDVDLTNKKVVVVGSGASAIQAVPAIADQVKDLTVVQRSPNWVMWKSRRTPGPIQTALLRRFRWLRTLHHMTLFLAYESRYPMVTRAADPIRRLGQWYLIRRLKRHVTDPAEVAAATPHYRMMCNRILLSNDWYPTIGREDVHLVGSAVERVDETGVWTADGRHIDADVIICCTGFKASEFLSPISIHGRGGTNLHQRWAQCPAAYLGMTVPNFPNMFMVFGPNTNSITNTIVFLLERQASYIRQVLDHKERNNLAWLDVSDSTYRKFQRWVENKLDRTVFTDNCPGWYTNDQGKVTAMWPASHLTYAWLTRRFQPDEFVSGVALQPVSASGPSDREFEAARR
jgi:cation diffusion facilitator CzcD-associated flavoprotein CzcO